MFSVKGEKNTKQTSSDCAMSLMCCKYSVLEAFYVKYLIGLDRFLLTVLSEDCNTPPILFFFLLLVTQTPLDICERRSVCFH